MNLNLCKQRGENVKLTSLPSPFLFILDSPDPVAGDVAGLQEYSSEFPPLRS